MDTVQAEPVVAEMTAAEFEELVLQDFSQKAVTVSPKQMDSIMASKGGDPDKGIAEIEKMLQKKRERAQTATAQKYNISLDSLNTILDKRKKDKPDADLK